MREMEKDHVYPSAVDWWWMVPLMIVVIYVSLADIITKFQHGAVRDGWIAVCVVLFVALLFPAIIIPCAMAAPSEPTKNNRFHIC